jgi:protocatechuate 4,5-dioxygenase, alpha chain
MTPENQSLVRDSFAKIEPITLQDAAIFYDRLFVLDPSLKRLFKADMTEQGRMLMAMIGTVVANLGNLETIMPAVQDLGRRHATYGVQPGHYETVGAPLLWTLEQGLGDAFTQPVKAAWTEAYAVLSSVMQKGADGSVTSPIHAPRGLTTMRKEYSGIPGTTVFDGEQSRRGYHLNQFCMSLLNPANRDRFKADEEAYLSEWNLTETQKSAVLRRDYNAMIAEGGNIYFLGKIGATEGKSFVQLIASMTGMTPESYTAMMVRGGRAPGAPLTVPQPTNPAEGDL